MSEPSGHEAFARIFRGRTDCYGMGTSAPYCVKLPLTDAVWWNHLNGAGAIGVYPLRRAGEAAAQRCVVLANAYVGWGCVDIDFDDLNLAKNIQRVLTEFGIPSYVEISRSKGYHVWVLDDTWNWFPAETMRDALRAACDIVDYSPKEVNPKQVDGNNTVGNFVRLPYPNGFHETPERQVVLSPEGDRWALPFFLQAVEWSVKIEYKHLAALAELAPPAVAAQTYEPTRRVTLTQDVLTRLSPLAWTVYKDGPLEGHDRSSTLVKLAHLCRESGLSPDESLSVVGEADARWGKFAGRDDADEQLRKIVGSAYR